MKFIPGDIVLIPDYWGSGDNRPHLVIHNCPDRGLRLCPLSRSSTGRLETDRLPARPGGLNKATHVAAVNPLRPLEWQLFWAPDTAVRRLVGTLDQELLQVALVACVRQRKVHEQAKARQLVRV